MESPEIKQTRKRVICNNVMVVIVKIENSLLNMAHFWIQQCGLKSKLGNSPQNPHMLRNNRTTLALELEICLNT